MYRQVGCRIRTVHVRVGMVSSYLVVQFYSYWSAGLLSSQYDSSQSGEDDMTPGATTCLTLYYIRIGRTQFHGDEHTYRT